FHGSPERHTDILLPERSTVSLDPYLSVGPADLLAGGHTHRQWTRQIGGALFANPGPVGAVWEDGQPTIARYALVVVDDLGLGVQFKQVRFDLAQTKQVARASGHPQPHEWLSQWS